MNIIAKASGGLNIVGRPQAREAWYPTATVAPAQVATYWRFEDEPAAAARLIGLFAPGQEVTLPYNPLSDRNVILSTISIAADGTRSAREIADAHEELVVFQRETDAPVIGQVGDATPQSVTIGVSGFTTLARMRRLSIAEALVGGALDDPTIQIFDAGTEPMPAYVDVSRSGVFVPAFEWLGNDPVGHGFTKTGSAPVEASGSGWRINSLGTDAATYYTKSSWPGSAFAAGFTLDFPAPIIVTMTDNANPAQCVAIRVEDGTHRYELTFDADEVRLNGGSSHAHGGASIRLVIAAGGATADLWIADTLTEDNTAFQATATSGLSFGDLTTTDDADAVWLRFGYSLTPVPVVLAQTIYIAISHSSGGDWTPDSNILTVTFANEGSATGGSTGDFEPTPRDEYSL